MAPRTLALALPAAGLVAAPLFVPGAPSTQGTQAPRTAAHAAAQTPSSGLSAATVGTVASAGVLVAALSRASGRTSRPHVARNFFGGPTSTPASFDPATELGVQDPVGFWDPLGLAADKDKATFNRRRAVELKHGRIAMYATIGYIVPEYFRWPGFLSPSLGLKFSDMPNGLAALSKLPVLGGAQIIAFAGLIETTGFFQAASTTDGRGPREGQFSMKDSTESAEPGNYGVGFPNFLGKVEDPEARKTKLAAELANGRLAMMAIIGMFFQDGLTGSAWGDWSTYTASPLRAYDPSEEVGAMPPLGFFDPLNFSKPGRPLGVYLQDLSDEEKFAWLRAAELKNGRVAMMLDWRVALDMRGVGIECGWVAVPLLSFVLFVVEGEFDSHDVVELLALRLWCAEVSGLLAKTVASFSQMIAIVAPSIRGRRCFGWRWVWLLTLDLGDAFRGGAGGAATTKRTEKLLASLSQMLSGWADAGDDEEEDDGYEQLFQDLEKIIKNRPKDPVRALQQLLVTWQAADESWIGRILSLLILAHLGKLMMLMLDVTELLHDPTIDAVAYVTKEEELERYRTLLQSSEDPPDLTIIVMRGEWRGHVRAANVWAAYCSEEGLVPHSGIAGDGNWSEALAATRRASSGSGVAKFGGLPLLPMWSGLVLFSDPGDSGIPREWAYEDVETFLEVFKTGGKTGGKSRWSSSGDRSVQGSSPPPAETGESSFEMQVDSSEAPRVDDGKSSAKTDSAEPSKREKAGPSGPPIPSGMVLKDNTGAGNCMYLAISDALVGVGRSLRSASDLRNVVCIVRISAAKLEVCTRVSCCGAKRLSLKARVTQYKGRLRACDARARILRRKRFGWSSDHCEKILTFAICAAVTPVSNHDGDHSHHECRS
ncbi:FCPF [Symbiodinium sp. CCMP2592]|nr:FCPF [Symbiodinium sp. CCMP2592]